MDSQGGIMDSDDVSNSVDDGEVLKSSGINDNLGPVLLVLWIQSWVDHLNRADESVAIDFVWERGIRDDTIEVHWISRGERSLVEFNILILHS